MPKNLTHVTKLTPLLMLTLILPALLLSTSCSTTAIPEAVESSEIPGQLHDGGWVMNIPGQMHTHRVVLEECPEQPVVTRHVHTRLQEEQMGQGPHKHKGCFVCPPKNPLVKRILN